MKAAAVKSRAYKCAKVGILSEAGATPETEFGWAPALDTENPILIQARAGAAVRAGRLAEAEVLYREAMRSTARVFDARHPHIATVAHGLVLLYASQGREDDARRLSDEIVELTDRERAVAANGRTLGRLADLYRRAGRAGEGLELYREALAYRRRVYGDRHHKVIECMARFSKFQLRLGNGKQARSLLQEAIDMLDGLAEDANRNVTQVICQARDLIVDAA